VYRGRRAQVLHALLLEPARSWHVHELAERAEVASSTVHEVFTFLEHQLWVEKEGTGPRAVRVLRDPGALLDAWAEAHSLAIYTFHRFHRWTQHPDQLLRSVARALDDSGADHALTLASGARLVAPFLTEPGTLSILVPEGVDLEAVARTAELQPADEGATVAFLATRDRWPLLSAAALRAPGSPATSNSTLTCGRRRRAARSRPGTCAPSGSATDAVKPKHRGGCRL
jgi:hypothetical protein